MAEPRFSNSTDFSQLAAGVFITDVSPPAVVQGVSAINSVIVGECVKGPVDRAVQIRSVQQLRSIYGGRDIVTGGAYAGHVFRDLLNKTTPSGFWVVRAAADAAAAATLNLLDGATPVVQVDASSVGAWGNGAKVQVTAATDGDPNHFDLIATWRPNEAASGGSTQRFTNLDVSATGNNNLPTRVGTGDEVLITVTKLADGVPDVLVATPLTGGTDDTIADTDFTATGRALDVAAGIKRVGQRHVAGRANAVIKGAVATKAGAASEGFWLLGPDDETVTITAALAEVATLARNTRLLYCWGHTKTLDNETGNLIVQEPMAVKSNNLARQPVHLGTGTIEVGGYNGGIADWASAAQSSVADGDYDAMFAAGITALERDADNGWIWRDQVTTFLQDGTDKFMEPRQRQVDFLLQNMAARAKNDINKPNTQLARGLRRTANESFLRGLMGQQLIVAPAEDGISDGFVYDTESFNDPAQKALGVQKDVVRVRRIPEARIINLVGQIGTTVEIIVNNNGATEA
jgi:hypothetical protein